MPPALFFLLEIALAIQDLLCFQMNFRIAFFYLCRKCHWDFHRDCIESVDNFGNIDILTILIINSWTWDIFPFFCVCNFFHNFFQQCYVFSVQVFTFLVKFISEYFILCDDIVNRIVLISFSDNSLFWRLLCERINFCLL